jgi:transposase
MALTIVETRAVTGGVDTHADVHVAAALDPVGGLLGVREFPVTPAGYARLLGWLGGFGTVALVGIEGTGSYGAGLARHVTAAGVRVVEGRPVRSAGPPPPRQDPARSTRSARRGPPCPAGPAARRRAGTAPSRRSAR